MRSWSSSAPRRLSRPPRSKRVQPGLVTTAFVLVPAWAALSQRRRRRRPRRALRRRCRTSAIAQEESSPAPRPDKRFATNAIARSRPARTSAKATIQSLRPGRIGTALDDRFGADKGAPATTARRPRYDGASGCHAGSAAEVAVRAARQAPVRGRRYVPHRGESSPDRPGVRALTCWEATSRRGRPESPA